MELNILKCIQSISSPFFDALFQLITIIGEKNVITILFILIYWTIDKKMGEYLGFSLFTSLLFNNSLKDIVRAERPIGENGIRSLRVETATGDSFPSGHTQSSANFYGSFAIYNGGKHLIIISFVLSSLIGISRLYLGVHYPKDVLFGLIFGFLIAVVCFKLFHKVRNRNKLYLSILILFLFNLLINDSTDFLKSIGGYIGFVVGIYLEKKYVNFSLDISFRKKIKRVIIGGLIVGVIYLGLGFISIESSYFYVVKYGIVTFLGIFLCPYLFKKFNL